ncbi:hypothetical protein [Actinomyces ruminis]|uniref:DUF2975 domain-containing protein n=1 Tax=Actinomyces ruminis TaxID=1937003 RepID=A0ABX4MDL0_9ACTO|nr:hypothetical protein [Actinomyces ruminis]PHP53306.1 hypothetical protein BW737_003640 [Actinomyces ruminis]
MSNAVPTAPSLSRRIRTAIANATAERDNPWGVPGRITTVAFLVIIALIAVAEPLIALLSILRDGILRVSVIATPGPIELRGAYTGVLEDTGLERTILYGYCDLPGWTLALEAFLIISYMALVFASLILFSQAVAPTSQYWQGDGDPWERIRCRVRYLRWTAFAAVCVYAAFGELIPGLLSPVSEDVSAMSVGSFWKGLPFAILVGVWTLTYFTEALHRLALRTAALAVENADLREETEGLV